MANLGVAFGDSLSQNQKRRLARRAFRNFTEAALGLFWSPRITPELIDQFVEIQGLEHIRAARAAGRGIVICSSHYGNWELGTLILGFKGVPLTMVTEPTRNPAIEALITRLRTASGPATTGLAIVPPAPTMTALGVPGDMYASATSFAA